MFKKILLIIIVTFNITIIKAQMIEKHGLVLKGGIGNIDSKLNSIPEITDNNIDYKSGFSVGYKFRINPKLNSFFIDVDANLGMKMWKSSYIRSISEPPMYEASSNYYSLSIEGTFNYKIYKGLNAGIGIEPLYYLYQEGEKSKNKFDIPLVAKLAYDFGKFEVGINYKYGLTNAIKTDYIKSGKIREVGIFLFIPF